MDEEEPVAFEELPVEELIELVEAVAAFELSITVDD